MKHLYLLFMTVVLLGTSCQQMVQSFAEKKGREVAAQDSLSAEQAENEDEERLYAEKYDIIQKKPLHNDTLYLVREYFLTGEKGRESWVFDGKVEGVSISYYPNGKEFIRLHFRHGRPYAVISSWDKQGEPLDMGTLKNGTGHLITYHVMTLKPAADCNLVNGLMEGEYKLYHSDGGLSVNCNYRNDTLNGAYTSYYPNGKTQAMATFINGYPQGEVIRYYANGKYKRRETWKDAILQVSSEYDRQGKIMTEARNISDQISQTKYDYYSTGKLMSKTTFVNGRKNGIFMYYFGNGNLRTQEAWKWDTLMSEKSYYEEGPLESECPYQQNEKHGLYKSYYPDGILRLEQEYKAGKKDGIYRSYYDNGKKYIIGTYVNDQPLGKFDVYAKDGSYKGVNEYK